jgi:hypothetical protein
VHPAIRGLCRFRRRARFLPFLADREDAVPPTGPWARGTVIRAPHRSTDRGDTVRPLPAPSHPRRYGCRPRPPHGVQIRARLVSTLAPALPALPHTLYGHEQPEPHCTFLPLPSAPLGSIPMLHTPKARWLKHPVGWTLALRLRTSTTCSCARGWPCGLSGSFLSVP